ncbi:MAG: L-serine ammonia-lyase, iron-sulfur-dependent, subunit alpha [Bacillota bacterium]
MDKLKFHTLQDWEALSRRLGLSLHELVVKLEAFTSGKSEGVVKEKMLQNWLVMQQAIADGFAKEGATMGELADKEALKLKNAVSKGIVRDDRLSKVCARALAVSELNAAMGRIVAAPTAGSCGILPAVLATVGEDINSTDDEIVDALFVAAGIGIVIAERASISGAEGGCQAECGSAAAMAAGAVVYLYNGAPEQVFHGAALALKNTLGLVCDPVAGLVEVPCIKRNAILAVQALAAADLALAGVKSAIPPDEVIDAMGEIGRCMPAIYKETALGGLAATPTGIKLKERIAREKS